MNSFFQARIKLTLWYMLISYSLLALFTVAVLSAERQAFADVVNLVNSHVRGVVFNIYLQEQINEFESNFARWLFIFDAVILVIATAASYWLSGRTLKPIERAMDDQQRFVADVSHELRTPLAGMSMAIEAYQRGNMTEAEAGDLINDLQADVKRMSGLVSGLLKLVRLESGDKQPSIVERVNFSEVVTDSIESIALAAKRQGLKVTYEIADDACVVGNSDEFRQVVTILLDNAIKYTPKKGAVRLELLKHHHQIKLTVFNSGPGVAADDLPYLFDRFYRGANAGDEGSGLGLAIARYIIEQHKGTIAVASQPNNGVTFRILLPLARPIDARH